MDTQKIKEIIADVLQISPDDVTPEKEFEKDLGADSLDRVEIIMNLEDALGIQVPDEAAEVITTVGDAIEQIQKLIG
ncbi:MAG: acyl carrier protein [Lachnospiraceae bacterium]|nr:acyl carrier protein [Lachnospiraceae bacterium]